MSVAAVVLAAGGSTRMGRPKALLQWRGSAFVEHAVALARAGGCDPIVVVCGATAIEGLDVPVVENAGWERGPLSSLQEGLRAIAAQAWTGVLVLTVDRPHVASGTVLAIVQAHAMHRDAVLQPAHEGRRGHPILHPRDVADMLMRAPPSSSARDIVRRPELASRRIDVVVEDPAILDNIDTPEALARLLSRDP